MEAVMTARPEITPKDLLAVVQNVLHEEPGRWRSPRYLWQRLGDLRPDLAEQVASRVGRYRNPARNNAVWFVSNTLYHLAKLQRQGYEVSDVDAVPSMKGESLWLVARAVDRRS